MSAVKSPKKKSISASVVEGYKQREPEFKVVVLISEENQTRGLKKLAKVAGFKRKYGSAVGSAIVQLPNEHKQQRSIIHLY